MRLEVVHQYSLWGQVAGYFDGDGSIGVSDLSNQPYKLGISLTFTDGSFEQIAMVRKFLQNEGVQTSNVLRTSASAWMVAVSSREAVLLTLSSMLPHLYKKANEARTAIKYLQGGISGNHLNEVFKSEVEEGRREKHPRRVQIHVPYAWTEGDRLMREGRKVKLRDAFGRYRAKVTPEDFESIKREHVEGKRLRDLVKEYPQYAREIIRRVTGGGRGYVGVKGRGRVETSITEVIKDAPLHSRASVSGPLQNDK